jgi:hypothetical protein
MRQSPGLHGDTRPGTFATLKSAITYTDLLDLEMNIQGKLNLLDREFQLFSRCLYRHPLTLYELCTYCVYIGKHRSRLACIRTLTLSLT